ncbi:trafficking protein particle complex subunit 2-like protein isoform X2 [Prionailurus bengalensis]|uniref:trafficking protein particle complex subunit 2-like protein isoform X2 n=1 Tax=Prionailurus bengalensis TaxID=37029 RepID=UPI001CA9AC4F|nr:trafficking protein particle complex subunit 2-like protein isoform X2 [Prionailurus bengalensis]
MAVCVAVIAKENYPLYIRSAPTENELKFHYMVHTSLDVVDEKISAMGKALVDQRELYLGLLYPTEDYKVYGYVTNSKVKFVMVVDSSNTALRDNEIRSMFRKLHNSYTDVMCNPFYNPGDRIQSSGSDAAEPGFPVITTWIPTCEKRMGEQARARTLPSWFPEYAQAFDSMVTSMMIQVC